MSDDLQRSLGRLESKVDILLEQADRFNQRVSAVEKKVWWFSGASAVVAWIASNFLGRH